jgi:hypothetical protein
VADGSNSVVKQLATGCRPPTFVPISESVACRVASKLKLGCFFLEYLGVAFRSQAVGERVGGSLLRGVRVFGGVGHEKGPICKVLQAYAQY